MSLSGPTRRLPLRCLYNPPLRTPISLSQQRRTKSTDSSSPSDNPILDEYRRLNPDTPNATDLRNPQQQQQAIPRPGDLARNSIFEEDSRRAAQTSTDPASASAASSSSSSSSTTTTKIGNKPRDLQTISRVIHPDPNNRARWHRKKVIQMIRKGGRMSKEEMVKRTEREHSVRSHNMKTSVKKLGMIARQIAGKTVDEAIVQMRFSKKKVAQEVLKQLEFARDEAVVMRGMGLGKVSATAAAGDEKDAMNQTSSSVVTGRRRSTPALPPAADMSSDTQESEASQTALVSAAQETPSTTAKPLEIQLKDGKRYRVNDPTKIYVDQAWVGRGPYGKQPDYRARGRINIMRTPWTSISLVLKEDATRVRQHREREAKRQKQLTEKVWTALPNRPIVQQRPYYSW